MSKLDLIIDRLRALPVNEQEAMADEIEFMLTGGAELLTPEQWATLDRRLADDTTEGEPHEAVMAELKKRIGA